MSFDGKTIAVTGGGSGIGAGVSRELAVAGAHVLVLDRNNANATAVALEIGGTAHQLDVTDEDRVNEVYGTVGRLDGLVNCAEYTMIAPIVATSLDDWRRMTAVHLDGTFLNLKAAAASMLTHHVGGSIVNITSINASFGHRGMSGYAASKAGISMLTRIAALELAPAGIRVNAVAPGIVETAMTSEAMTHDETAQTWRSGIPLGRLGLPADIARVVAFLLSEQAGWMTGQTLLADGGASIRVEPNVTPDEMWTVESLREAAQLTT